MQSILDASYTRLHRDCIANARSDVDVRIEKMKALRDSHLSSDRNCGPSSIVVLYLVLAHHLSYINGSVHECRVRYFTLWGAAWGDDNDTNADGHDVIHGTRRLGALCDIGTHANGHDKRQARISLNGSSMRQIQIVVA
jgi:hypothetical protein